MSGQSIDRRRSKRARRAVSRWVMAGAGVALAGGAANAAQLTTNWAAAVSGGWADVAPVRWDNGIPINAVNTYNANIAVTGSAYTVTLNVPVTVDNLTLSSGSATLSHTFGTLTANGAINLTGGVYSLAGGTIANSTVNATVPITLSASGGTLSGDTISGDLSATVGGSFASITNGTTFTTAHLGNAGTSLGFASGQTLSGTVQFEGAATGLRSIEMNGAAGTFTIGATGVVKTVAGLGGNGQIGTGPNFGGAMTLVNNGLISSQVAGHTITINPATSFTNNGDVEGLGGVAALNTGTATNTGTLTINGGVTLTGDFNNNGGAAVLGGTQSWTSGAHLNANAGSVTLAGNPGSNASYGLIVNVTPASGNSATVNFATSGTDLVQLRSLNINAPGANGADKVVISAATSGASANPMTHFGGVGGSVAVYLGNGAGTAGLAPRAEVESIWASAALEGYWALRNNLVSTISRGVTLSANVVTTTQNGLVILPSVDNASQPVTYLGEDIIGDANGDGQDDANDVTVVLAHLNKAPGTVGGEAGYTIYTPAEGDVNGDLKVDVNDVTAVLANLGLTYSPAASSGGVGAIATPEPAGALLLALGAAAILRRRRLA